MPGRIQVLKRTPREAPNVEDAPTGQIHRALTVTDRTTIELRLSDGWSIRAIARGLSRSAGTISDEIRRHGGVAAYRAQAACEEAAVAHAQCGRWRCRQAW